MRAPTAMDPVMLSLTMKLALPPRRPRTHATHSEYNGSLSPAPAMRAHPPPHQKIAPLHWVRRMTGPKVLALLAMMQTISSRIATFPYKHSASWPCWLAATSTPFALPQTSAAATPPATPGGGVATHPIAWGRPVAPRHPPLPSTQRPHGWKQEIAASGEEGDAGAPHCPPLACQRQYMAQRLAHPPARPRGGRGRPDHRAPTGNMR